MKQMFDIEGMTCQGCVAAVTRVITQVPGVMSAHVCLDEKRAVVDGEAPPERIQAAIEAAGFGARPLYQA